MWRWNTTQKMMLSTNLIYAGAFAVQEDLCRKRPLYSHVAFFIYKVDTYVLRTPYGEFQLSSEMQVPRRLQQIIEIDEDYM